jgi:hypothetical protein
MSKSSKQLLKILKFYANHTRHQVLELKRNNPKKYFKTVPADAEDILHSQGYIHFEDKPSNHTAITTIGLDKLMILEDHNAKQWSLKIAIL